MSDDTGSTNKGAALAAPLRMFKYTYSCILLIFSMVLIIGNIFARQTRLADQSHPAVALVVMLIAITWLTMVEGGQGMYTMDMYIFLLSMTHNIFLTQFSILLSQNRRPCRSWSSRSRPVQGKSPHELQMHPTHIQGR